MTTNASRIPALQGTELTADSALYHDVLESMDGGVMTVGFDGGIGLFNAGASRLLGLSGDEVRGKPFGQLFVNLEGMEEFNDVVLGAVYDRSVGDRTTVSVRTADGTERALAVTAVYLVERTGGETRNAGIVVVFEDVTELESLRRTERQLAEVTEKQNAELRDAYREIDEKNRTLDLTLKRVQAVRALAMVLVAVLFLGATWYVWDQVGTAPMEGAVAASQTSPGTDGEVRTVAVVPRRLTVTLAFVGRLAPQEEVRVTSPTAGKVAKMRFEYGGAVEAGQTLIELDVAETKRRYRAARAEYLEVRGRLMELEDWENGAQVTRLRRSLARANMELEERESRLEETALLLEQGIIPASEHRAAERQREAARLSRDAALQDLELASARASDDALEITRLRLENASANMRDLESTLDQAVIRAPVSGIVLQPGSLQSLEQEDETALSPGRSVSEGAYLVTIGNLGGLSVAGQVDELDVMNVRPGQPVTIRGDAFPDMELQGTIKRVAAQSGNATGNRVPTFDVTAVVDTLADADRRRLRLGMSANVVVVVRNDPVALLVPIAAVHGEAAGEHWVLVPDGGGGPPRRTPVELGTTTLNDVEVVAGLQAGDEVVLPDA